jgi:hypothetical protein
MQWSSTVLGLTSSTWNQENMIPTIATGLPEGPMIGAIQ